MSFLLHSGSVFDYCKIQALGQLWVTERAWVDIMSYCPGLPPAIVRIGRDEAFIEKLASAVTAFSNVLEEQAQLLAERGWLTPKPQPEYSMRGTMEALKQSLVELAGKREP